MFLKHKLIQIKPRETSGSKTSNRFDFQKNWAICKLIELHKKAEDYIVIFEYHDDVLILNSAQNPDKISFYQIKSKKSGAWTINSLIKKDEINSILGNLYLNKINFDSETESLNLVSNANFKVNMNGGSYTKENVCCNDLDDKEKEKVNNALKNEHELSESPNFQEITYFHNADLDIDHHDEITQGRLAQLIELLFPNVNYRAISFHKSLIGEIRRKSNYEKEVNSFDELISKKAISKRDFDVILDTIKSSNNTKTSSETIESYLDRSTVPFHFLRKFQDNWRRVQVEKIDNNISFERIYSKINKVVSGLSENDLGSPLWDCVNYVHSKLKQSRSTQHLYDENFVKTIIIEQLNDICKF